MIKIGSDNHFLIWFLILFYSKVQFTFWSDLQSFFLWSWSEKDQNFPIVFCYGNRYFFCIFLKESLKKSSHKIKTSIHKLKKLFNIKKKILCFILKEMLNGILFFVFLIQENPGLQHLAEEITKKFWKKVIEWLAIGIWLPIPFSRVVSDQILIWS